MRTIFHPACKCRLLLVVTAVLLIFRPDAWSAVLTYNTAANKAWFEADAWNGPATWTSGDSAVIDAVVNSTGTTIEVDGSTNVTNLTMNGVARLTSGGTNTLTMSGGDITVTNLTWGSYIQDGVTIQGDYTKKGDGWLRINGSSDVSAYAGTATLQAGTVSFGQLNLLLGASSNFVVTGATLSLQQGNSAMGALTLNSGAVNLGRTNGDQTFTLTMSSFAGNGGTMLATVRTSGSSTNPTIPTVQTVVVDQTANTGFSGTIQGVTPSNNPATQSDARIAFTKSGSGDLSLSGAIELVRETTISGGRLYINSANATFANETAGTTAIAVTSGLLGGTGTITTSSDNSNVVLGANGQLSAGLVGSAGRTTYALGTGTLNLSSATASANTGWLHFALGGLTVPGTDYGQILLSSGTLDIGTGLNFEDFSFTALGNFGPGQYVLFDTPNSILGTLGMSTTGTINGLDATLSFLGSDKLVLDVIPEPHAGVLLLSGIGLLWLARRRRQ